MLRKRHEDLLELCDRHHVLLKTKETGRHYLLTSTKEHTEELFEFSAGFKDAEFRRIVATEIMEDLGKLGLLGKTDGDKNEIGVILTPAMGGILLGATLQHLFYGEKPTLLYTEKRALVQGLHRNFRLPKDRGILLFDDVYTSGGTLNRLADICKADEEAGPIVARAAVVNRNPHGLPREEDIITEPHIFLIRYPIVSYKADQCPSCRKGIPLEKDGVTVDKDGNPIKSG